MNLDPGHALAKRRGLVIGVEARAQGRRFLLGDIDLAWLDPSLSDVAPPGVARAFRSDVDPSEPPDLEALAQAPPAVRDAAEAAGWLDAGGPTEELRELLRIRPIEREAALRRSLRAPPLPEEPHLLQSWRAWALLDRPMRPENP